MDNALKLVVLLIGVAIVGFLMVRDMERSETTDVAGWTINIPASVTAGALALLSAGVAAYFWF